MNLAANEIDVGSDVGDWGNSGRVADIGQPTRLTHKRHQRCAATVVQMQPPTAALATEAKRTTEIVVA
jgi:hypothetical protein